MVDGRAQSQAGVDIEHLIEGLEELADRELQARLWMATEGPEVSSFVEMSCQTFDDTGLADALVAGPPPAGLSEQAFSLLRNLEIAVQKVDGLRPPEQLLLDPGMQIVRELASQALAQIRKNSL